MKRSIWTRSSAIADEPRDASCQLKSCQLPRNSAETTCTTSPEQIDVMKLEGQGKVNTTSYSTLTETMRPSCTVFKRKKMKISQVFLSFGEMPCNIYNNVQ